MAKCKYCGAEYYRIIRKNHLQDPNHIEVGQKLYL